MNQVKLGAVSNREDYSEAWQALDEDGTAIDLTGATIVYEFRHPETKAATAATVVISTTTFTATIPVATMRGLCASKEFDVGCTIEQDDVTTQFFVGTIPIIDGVVT
jgi:hypothetical protein